MTPITKAHWSDCVDGLADLRLCGSQTPEDRFSRVETHIVFVFPGDYKVRQTNSINLGSTYQPIRPADENYVI